VNELSYSKQLVALVAGVALSIPALSAEYMQQSGPVASSATEFVGALGYAFTHPTEQPWYLLDDLKEAISDTHPFFAESRLSADLRTFGFDRSNGFLPDGDAWATGGQFRYQSGGLGGFSLGAAWYNSTELDANGAPVGLIKPDGDNINVWGEANIKYRFSTTLLEDSELTLYRQKLSLPFINTEDARMLPSTHEGYMLQMSEALNGLIVGHVTRFKARDDDEFRYLSDVAGAPGSDDGATVLGGQIGFGENTTMGVANQYGWETFNTFYSEVSHSRRPSETFDYRLSAQYTNQQSVGDELIGDFTTWQTALQVAAGWRGAVVRLAGSRTGDGARIRSPWGSTPSYLSIQRSDFDSAGERAVLLGLSYNPEYFTSLGWSSFFNVAHGWDRRLASENLELPDRTEYNWTLDYKPPEGMLRGLWLRFRWAHVDVEGDGGSVRDLRLILNYDLSLL